jgi:hypothetical protein
MFRRPPAQRRHVGNPAPGHRNKSLAVTSGRCETRLGSRTRTRRCRSRDTSGSARCR